MERDRAFGFIAVAMELFTATGCGDLGAAKTWRYTQCGDPSKNIPPTHVVLVQATRPAFSLSLSTYYRTEDLGEDKSVCPPRNQKLR